MFMVRLVQIIAAFAIFFGMMTREMIYVLSGIGFGVLALLEIQCQSIENCMEVEETDNESDIK